MATAPEVEAVGPLLLTRLLPGGDKGASRAQLRKDLAPLVEHRWPGAAWAGLLDRALGALEAEGAVARRTAGRGKAESFALTEAGRGRALALLGLGELPPKTTWASLKKTYLVARALGLPAPRGGAVKAFSGNPGFKAALLRAEFGLPVDAYPTAKAANDALCWKLLGFESRGREPLTIKALQKALFDRELGEHRQGTPQQEFDRILARAIGARRVDANELRDAAVRRWVDRSSTAAPGDGRPESPPDGPDLPRFADRVLSAARSSGSGRFGDKVFIAHVWRAVAADPSLGGMDVVAFKRRLGEANRARLLDLARADLVEAMDPVDVRESETEYLGATFHFVRLGREAADGD